MTASDWLKVRHPRYEFGYQHRPNDAIATIRHIASNEDHYHTYVLTRYYLRAASLSKRKKPILVGTDTQNALGNDWTIGMFSSHARVRFLNRSSGSLELCIASVAVRSAALLRTIREGSLLGE